MKKTLLLFIILATTAVTFAQKKEVEYQGTDTFEEDKPNTDNDTNFKVYPNPTRNSLTVNLGDLDGVLSFQINDSFGKSVYHRRLVSYDLQKDSFKLDMSSFEEGIYMFYVNTKTASKTVKVVKL